MKPTRQFLFQILKIITRRTKSSFVNLVRANDQRPDSSSADMPNASDLYPLPYSVVKVSSEEKGYGASTLSAYSLDSDGWQSNATERSDTQTLELKIQHNDEENCMIHALEIICHGALNA